MTLCCCSYDARKNFLLQGKSEILDTKEFLGCSLSQGRLAETGTWVKVNVDQAGFYRVKYDDELAGRLRYAIETKCLSAMDRYGNLLLELVLYCVNRQSELLTFSYYFPQEFWMIRMPCVWLASCLWPPYSL